VRRCTRSGFSLPDAFGMLHRMTPGCEVLQYRQLAFSTPMPTPVRYPRWLLKSRYTGLFILTPVLPNPRHAPHAAGSSPINFSVSHHHTRITEEVERTSTSVNKDYCTVSPSRTEPIPSFLPNIDLVTIHFTAPLPPSFPRGSQAEAVTPAARTWLIRLVSSRLDSTSTSDRLSHSHSFSHLMAPTKFPSPSPPRL
jgi:hypothetical protein